MDYILFALPSTMPALPTQRGFIQRRIVGAPPLSLVDVERGLRRIAEDPRPKGVVFMLRGLSLSLADLQTLRGLVMRLRADGKRVICYAQDYSIAEYFVASAADEIILQPGGVVNIVGLRQQIVFLRDALATLGLQLDAVAISPYKGALDQFTRSDFSPESREQFEWLLDSRYDMIVRAIAEGRATEPEAIRAMIDAAPYIDTAAQAAEVIDAVLNEEALQAHLGAEHLVPWEQAEKSLFRKWQNLSPKYVALLPIRGTIIQGESQRIPGSLPVPLPLLDEDRAGDITVTQTVRRLMKDENAAAVVLYIDSPGGSAAASEAMASALDELAKSRPVVAYMNAVAASGGYYVATPARWIVAQPGTITGSIGVILGKLITAGLYDRLHINRAELTRGRNATIEDDSAPFSDEQRTMMRAGIERIYGQFTARVAASRSMTVEAVDAVGAGRVWTGEQALGHGLVDELGDLRTALNKARALAALGNDSPLVLVREGGDDPLPPQLAQQANPAAWMDYAASGARQIFNTRAQLILPLRIRDRLT